MTVDVVIPNYNGLKLLEENLPRVIESVKGYKGSIIIVDDCSQESEFEALRDFVEKLESKNIILLRNEKNLGFSSTVNRGVKESDATIVILLNTDVVPEEKFLDPIIKDFKEDQNLFGVGCMDKSIEGDKIVLRGRGMASFQRGLLLHWRGDTDKTDTFWISGGSSAVRREFFEKLKGFDTLFNPFYWEDIDLSYRARKSGFNIKFEPASVVEHRHTEGSIKKHYSDFQIKTIAYRNQFIFVWKNITDVGFIVSALMWFPYHMLSSLLKFDIPMLLGMILAAIRLPDIIRKRFEQEKLCKLRDSDLLQS